jgi:hypothetical protein
MQQQDHSAGRRTGAEIHGTREMLAQESGKAAGTRSSNTRRRLQTEFDLHSQKASRISDGLGAGGSQLGRGRAMGLHEEKDRSKEAARYFGRQTV